MNTPFQPNFQNIQGRAPGTEFDNLSEDELLKLINAAHKVKTGRSGSLYQTAPPQQSRVVDLDAILEKVKNG